MLSSLALITALVGQRPFGTIDQELRRDGRFKDTLAVLHRTGLDLQTGSTSGKGYTLFAARDDVYAKLPKEARLAILTNDGLGSAIVANHMLAGKYGTMSFMNGLAPAGQPLKHTVKTLADTTFEIVSTEKGLFIGKVQILRDIPASNGNILQIDGLIPYEIPKPKGQGFERVIPAELIKWGLGRYRG